MRGSSARTMKSPGPFFCVIYLSCSGRVGEWLWLWSLPGNLCQQLLRSDNLGQRLQHVG
jgi:hypothetical protein